MKKIIIIPICIFIAAFSLSASPNAEKETEQKLKKIEKHVIKENYNKALDIIVELVLSESDNPELNYYAGICYYKSGNKDLADLYFSKAEKDKKVKLQVYYFKKIMEDETFMKPSQRNLISN